MYYFDRAAVKKKKILSHQRHVLSAVHFISAQPLMLWFRLRGFELPLSFFFIMNDAININSSHLSKSVWGDAI